MLLYGLYTPLVGVLNGRKKFVYQAGLDVLAATLRTFGLISGGYCRAARVSARRRGRVARLRRWERRIVLFGGTVLGRHRKGAGAAARPCATHVAFIAPLLFGQVVLNLLLQADLTFLRMFAADSAERAGLALVAADPLVGAVSRDAAVLLFAVSAAACGHVHSVSDAGEAPSATGSRGRRALRAAPVCGWRWWSRARWSASPRDCRRRLLDAGVRRRYRRARRPTDAASEHSASARSRFSGF